MRVLNTYLLTLPLPVIIQISGMVVTIIVFFYGTGVITRKLAERKLDLKIQQDEALERQRIAASIKNIEDDIAGIKQDGSKKENYIKDIEKQLHKIKMELAKHLKITIDD